MQRVGRLARQAPNIVEGQYEKSGETENRLVTMRDAYPVVLTVEPKSRNWRTIPTAAAVVAAAGLVGILWGWGVTRRAAPGATVGVATAAKPAEKQGGPVHALKAGGGTPIISDITTTSAKITWTTDQPLTSQVEYGATARYGSLSAFGPSPVTSHEVTLTGLTSGTTYNFETLSTGVSGQITRSANSSFTTTSAAGAPVITKAVTSDVTSTSATITWTTDQPSASQVEYGATPAYGLLSAFNRTLVTSHSMMLTGLTPGVTYDFAVLSTNSAEQVGTSGNFTFTTTGTTGTPLLNEVMADKISATSATITWRTEQPSASQVEYGKTTQYGLLSAYSPSPVTTHSITLTGLTPGTRYNAAALSANPAGRVGASDNVSFTTLAAPPVISQLQAVEVTASSAVITWKTDQPATSRVQYGTTTAYGAMSSDNPALITSHSVTIGGLKPGMTYNSAAISTNSAGMQNASPNLTFTTPAR